MITVTEAARDKIASMCIENDMEAVRPFIHGGGCAGMQHSMTFADKKEEREMKTKAMALKWKEKAQMARRQRDTLADNSGAEKEVDSTEETCIQQRDAAV
mgnify:CR=1 FL=1